MYFLCTVNYKVTIKECYVVQFYYIPIMILENGPVTKWCLLHPHSGVYRGGARFFYELKLVSKNPNRNFSLFFHILEPKIIPLCKKN